MATSTQPLILLVEDSHDLCDAIGSFLRSRGYRVTVEHDGDAAVRTAKKELPDLILTDVFLGSTSGLDLITALRTHLPSAAPIIACSGLPDVAPAARARGAVTFLPKPIDPVTLERAIEGALQHQPPADTVLAEGERRSYELRCKRLEAARQSVAALGSHRLTLLHQLQRDVQWLSAYFGSGTALVAFFGKDGLHTVASSDRLRWPADRDVAEALPISRHILETGSAFVVPDLAGLSLSPPPPTAPRFFAGFPLSYHQTPIGVVCLIDDRPRRLDKADFALLEELCAGGSALLSGDVSRFRTLPIMRRSAMEAVLRAEFDRANRFGLIVHLFAFASRSCPPDILAERTLVAELGDGRYGLLMTFSAHELSPPVLIEAVRRLAALPGFGGGDIFSIEIAAMPRIDPNYVLALADRRVEERIAAAAAPSIRRIVIRNEALGELTTPGAVT